MMSAKSASCRTTDTSESAASTLRIIRLPSPPTEPASHLNGAPVLTAACSTRHLGPASRGHPDPIDVSDASSIDQPAVVPPPAHTYNTHLPASTAVSGAGSVAAVSVRQTAQRIPWPRPGFATSEPSGSPRLYRGRGDP